MIKKYLLKDEQLCHPQVEPCNPVRRYRRLTFWPVALLLLAVSKLQAGTTGSLETGTYKIDIEVRCEEGEVTCDDVGYVSKNKKTGEKLELTGKTAHHMDADGTPGRFLGYVFKNKGVTYFLSEEGLLRITQGDEVVLQEHGTWTWNESSEATDRKK